MSEVYEITYSTTVEVDADSLTAANAVAIEMAKRDPRLHLLGIKARSKRLEQERKEAEYRAWKAKRDLVHRQHPQLEHRRDGRWECFGCLRVEDAEDAFLNSCCLGWGGQLEEYRADHEAGEHNFTTRMKVGDNPWGPETFLYDHKCPRCIEQHMKGEPTRA